MSWGSRSQEDKEKVFAILDERAQPLIEKIGRETMDRDGSTDPGTIAACNAAIEAAEAELGPIQDAKGVLQAL